MSNQTENPKKYIGFHCPTDLHEWLKSKGEEEHRNLSNSVVHALQTAKAACEAVNAEG